MFFPYKRKEELDKERIQKRPSLPLELPLPPDQEPARRREETEHTIPRGIWEMEI